MDRLTFLYIITGVDIVLAIWTVIVACLLKIRWYYRLGLALLALGIAPLAFALTMYVKYRIRKKNGRPKNKPGKKKKDSTE